MNHYGMQRLLQRELIIYIRLLREIKFQNIISKQVLPTGIPKKQTQKKNGKTFCNSTIRLLQIEYSPIAALNRTYALSKANGKLAAITEAEKLNLINNQYYFTLLGELYTDVNNRKAKLNFEEAFSLAKTQAEKLIIQKKIDHLLQGD